MGYYYYYYCHSHNWEHLYFNSDDNANQLLSLLSSLFQFTDLRDDLLREIASSLRYSFQLSPAVFRVIPLIGNNLEHDSLVAMTTLDKATVDSAIFQPVSHTHY